MTADVKALPLLSTGEKADPRRWLALGVLLLAAFMDLIDVTIVNVAIPAISQDLGASYAAIQWVLAAYTLAFALVLVTGGRLGDIFGRKRVFLIGVVGFTLASLLCGVAQDPTMLIASRVFQGAMGALMIPQLLSIIQVGFPPSERAAAFGMYGGFAGLAAVGGPIIGGLIIDGNPFDLGWRAIFLINLPVGILAFVAAIFLVRESKAPRTIGLDPVGLVLLTAALVSLLYPLVQGRELGWPLWTFLLMFASVPLLALFAWYEWRKGQANGSPLVPPQLFGRRAFVAGMLVSAVFFAGVAGFFLIFTLYLQIGLGFTALQAGLAGTPWAVGVALGSGASVQLAARIGRPLLNAGALLMTLGILGLILTVGAAGTELTQWHLLPALAVGGLGMGLVIAPLVDIILAGVPDDDAGSASGVINTTMQVGSAAGIAAIGVIFFGLLASQATPSAEALAPAIRTDLQAAGVPAAAVEGIISSFRTCAEDRAAATDPSTEPLSCAEAQPGASQLPAGVGERIGTVLGSAGEEARKRTFIAATERTMPYAAGAFFLSFLLIFLLPRKAHATH